MALGRPSTRPLPRTRRRWQRHNDRHRRHGDGAPAGWQRALSAAGPGWTGRQPFHALLCGLRRGAGSEVKRTDQTAQMPEQRATDRGGLELIDAMRLAGTSRGGIEGCQNNQLWHDIGHPEAGRGRRGGHCRWSRVYWLQLA